MVENEPPTDRRGTSRPKKGRRSVQDLFRAFIASESASGGAEQLLRLEHVILSHQGALELGSPKSPMTPEALIVHHADDLDAKLQMMYLTLADDTTAGPMTSSRNARRQKIYRGGETEENE